MLDARETTASTADFVALARNCYRRFTAEGVAYVGRPGFSLMGAQIGTVGNRTANWCGQFTKFNGTTYTIRVNQGEIYTYNWGTNAWSVVVTAANFATASVTRSATARWYAVPFNDKLIFTDGVNVPFSWTGASGAGGLAAITDCPVLFGAPAVYYSKFMGVRNDERDTLVWSEEADETIGYEAGGYTNAWSLGGPGSERMFAIGATNQALTVIRERSATTIRGAVSTDFQTAATTPDVSSTHGTNTPFCKVLDEGVLFIDQDGRPHLIVLGAPEPLPLWGAFAEYLRGINTTALANCHIVEDPGCDVVLVGIPSATDTWPSTFFAYQRTAGRLIPVALWSGWTAQTMGLVKDGNGVWKWMHVGANDGYAYVHDVPTGTTWNDAQGTMTVPIDHSLVTRPLGTDMEDEMVFDEIGVHSSADTECTIGVTYVTPRGRGSSQTLALGLTGSAWDVGLWDTATWASDAADQRGRVGVIARGRWIQPEITHSVLNQKFAIMATRARGMVENADPLIP